MRICFAEPRISSRQGRGIPGKGAPQFRISSDFPLSRISIRFGSDPIPPEEQRLKITDLVATPMEYPREALQNEIEARVMVAVTFDTGGPFRALVGIWQLCYSRPRFAPHRGERAGIHTTNNRIRGEDKQLLRSGCP